MNKFIWVLQIVLALFFIMPGVTKIITPKKDLVEKKMLTPDGSVTPIRAIGLMEVLGCLGMILPMWLRIRPVLTPIAAIGFCVVMAGAFAFHSSKGEYKILPLLVIVFIISATVAWYRFKKKAA
jgi:hypothetical protein